MKASDYTPEQVENAMLYGVCIVCNTPREHVRGERTEDGKTVMWSALVAPCGHSQYPALASGVFFGDEEA